MSSVAVGVCHEKNRLILKRAYRYSDFVDVYEGRMSRDAAGFTLNYYPANMKGDREVVLDNGSYLGFQLHNKECDQPVFVHIEAENGKKRRVTLVEFVLRPGDATDITHNATSGRRMRFVMPSSLPDDYVAPGGTATAMATTDDNQTFYRQLYVTVTVVDLDSPSFKVAKYTPVTSPLPALSAVDSKTVTDNAKSNAGGDRKSSRALESDTDPESVSLFSSSSGSSQRSHAQQRLPVARTSGSGGHEEAGEGTVVDGDQVQGTDDDIEGLMVLSGIRLHHDIVRASIFLSPLCN